MAITVTIEIDPQDATHLEDFVNWATTEHFKAAIPSRDADKAWEVRQAANRISAAIQAYFQQHKRHTMNDETLSLVKLAQELCNDGENPQAATDRLLDLARSEPALRYLQEADQAQAIAELERRFSGLTTKPWEVQP
jgi:type II secretory pathway pseudopilin PulG